MRSCIGLIAWLPILELSGIQTLPHNLLPVENINVNSTTQCVDDILEAVLPCKSIVTFINLNDTPSALIEVINKLSCHTLTVLTGNFFCPTTFHPTDAFVLSVHTATDLDRALNCISRNIFWKPTAYFVTVVPFSTNKPTLEEFFQIFLANRVYKAIVLNHVDGSTYINTYSPFANGSCGKSVGDLLSLGACDKIEGRNGDYFLKVRSDAIKNCTITVAGGEDIPNFIIDSKKHQIDEQKILGKEQFIIENIARLEQYNVKYVYANAKNRYGVILSNNSVTGMLRKLHLGEADIAAGGFMLIQNRAQKFDFIWGYHYASYNLFNHAVVERRWAYIHKEFSTMTWTLILAVFVASVLTSYLISRILNKLGSEGYKPIYLIINLWGYLFTNSSSQLNKRKAFRCVLVGWIWFTFFIGQFYSTALYSSVTSKLRKSEYKDLNYFIENGYRPCISQSAQDFFLFAFNQILPKGPHRPECAIGEECFTVLVKDPDSYALEPDHKFKTRDCEFLDAEGYQLLEEWKFSETLLGALYFNRGSPYIESFHKYIRYMYESGLMDKQELDINWNNRKLCYRKVKVFHKYNMRDLRTPFIILLIGSVISFLTYIVEVQRNRQHDRNTQHGHVESDSRTKGSVPLYNI